MPGKPILQRRPGRKAVPGRHGSAARLGLGGRVLASGGAELVSRGAVLPCLAVLSDPERLWQQPLLQAMAGLVVPADQEQLMRLADLLKDVELDD